MNQLQELPENIINKILLFVSHPVADLIKEEIEDNYSDVSFASYYFTIYYQTNMCDCCALLRRECKCVCNNCYDNYKNCMMRCFEEPRQKMFYSSSSKKYELRDFIN